MQCYAKLCKIMQCYANDYAMLCNIMHCYAKLCNIMQHQNYTKYKSNGGEQNLLNAFRSLFVVQVATMRRRPPPPPRHAHVQPAATKTSWTASPTLTRCQWQHIVRSTSTRKNPPERAWRLVQVDGEEGRQQPANLYQTLSNKHAMSLNTYHAWHQQLGIHWPVDLVISLHGPFLRASSMSGWYCNVCTRVIIHTLVRGTWTAGVTTDADGVSADADGVSADEEGTATGTLPAGDSSSSSSDSSRRPCTTYVSASHIL
jgi:hypothetical protein